jgi:Zn-dependent protease
MRSGLKIGKVAGIEIDIDWSWLLILALVTWNLATLFRAWHPDWDALPTVALALVAALLLFTSVVVHELAHALVAGTQSVPVRDITLFLFGGVSDIRREPPTPRAEFLIAIVGPLTSIVLGVVFLLFGGLGLDRVGTSLADPAQVYATIGPVTTLLLWLGPTNLLLGIFNLIPAFPLDGGRVLRAFLWWVTGNLRRATRWATLGTHLVSWALILAGIAMVVGVQLPLFGSGAISGVWLAFIGWFLHTAATRTYEEVVIRDLLVGVPVARLMRAGQPSAVAPDLNIADLVQERILGTEDRAFPVLEGERLVGLVCLDDVRGVARTAWSTTTVRQIMIPLDRLAVAYPEEESDEAFATLAERDVDQLPVVQGGRLVGLLRRRDIVRWLQLQGGGAMA